MGIVSQYLRDCKYKYAILLVGSERIRTKYLEFHPCRQLSLALVLPPAFVLLPASSSFLSEGLFLFVRLACDMKRQHRRLLLRVVLAVLGHVGVGSDFVSTDLLLNP